VSRISPNLSTVITSSSPFSPHVRMASRLQSEYGTVSLVTSRPTSKHTTTSENKINILFRLSTVRHSKCKLQWIEGVGDLRTSVNPECSKCQNDHTVSYNPNNTSRQKHCLKHISGSSEFWKDLRRSEIGPEHRLPRICVTTDAAHCKTLVTPITTLLYGRACHNGQNRCPQPLYKVM